MDMLYEAKVMDVEPAEKPAEGYRYKIHYKGWKNTWDDWVLVDRIRPFDAEHKELAAQLHAQLKQSMQKSTKPVKKNAKGAESSRGSEERGSVAAQGGRGGRRGKDWELEQVSFDCQFDISFLSFPFLFTLFQAFCGSTFCCRFLFVSSCSTLFVRHSFVRCLSAFCWKPALFPLFRPLPKSSNLVLHKLRTPKAETKVKCLQRNNHSLQENAVAAVKVHFLPSQSLTLQEAHFRL